MEYEYCVMSAHYPGEPHRLPPEEANGLSWCTQWVEEWDSELRHLFYVARRPVGRWEKV